MLFECMLTRMMNGRAKLWCEGRELHFDRASKLSLNELLEKCLVSEDDSRSRPGGGYTQRIMLDDSYAMKSWRRDKRFQEFFLWSPPEAPKREPKARPSQRPVGWPFVASGQEPERPRGEPATPPVLKERDDDRPDVPRKRGKMIWSHKTAPELEIEGQGSAIDPEGIAAQRRR